MDYKFGLASDLPAAKEREGARARERERDRERERETERRGHRPESAKGRESGRGSTCTGNHTFAGMIQPLRPSLCTLAQL